MESDMPCAHVYEIWYSIPALYRLCSETCIALYFWLAPDCVPEIWVMALYNAGLPERYGLGSGACPGVTSCFWKNGIAAIRCVPCWPTYPTLSTLLAGS